MGSGVLSSSQSTDRSPWRRSGLAVAAMPRRERVGMRWTVGWPTAKWTSRRVPKSSLVEMIPDGEGDFVECSVQREVQ